MHNNQILASLDFLFGFTPEPDTPSSSSSVRAMTVVNFWVRLFAKEFIFFQNPYTSQSYYIISIPSRFLLDISLALHFGPFKLFILSFLTVKR